MDYKDFRSTVGDIRVASTSGHSALITNTFSPIPDVLWGQAYMSGAISRDMRIDNLTNYLNDVATEKLELESIERQKYKDILSIAFNDPIKYVDNNGQLIFKNIITLFLPDLPKQSLVNEIWDLLVIESSEESLDTSSQPKRRGRPPATKTEV